MQTNSPCDADPRSMHLTSKKTAAKNPEAVRLGSRARNYLESLEETWRASAPSRIRAWSNSGAPSSASGSASTCWAANHVLSPQLALLALADYLKQAFSTTEVKGTDILGRLQELGFLPQMQCEKDKPSGLPAKDKASTDGYPAAHVESENSTGYGTSEVLKRTGAGNISYSLDSNMSEQLLLPVAGGVTTRNDAELQAKSATVKNWACVNFSCIGSEELLKFLRSLGRVCVKNGMDFNLEPTMLVHMSSSCRADLALGLYIVKEFFQMKEDDSKFLLVILPDDRHSDEKIEKICRDIGVVYQCCLPLFGCISPYLDIVTNEIKAKVINSCNDTSGGLMAGYEGFINEEMVEYDGYDNEEMREYDGYNNEEMGDDDGNSCGEMGEDVCNEMESLELCSSDNELCKYTSKERRSEASHSNGSPDGEISEQQHFTTMTDGILQAKSVNVTWACVNFSCLSGKEMLRFLCNLGKMCASIGMDLSPEPSILIHMDSTRETDFGTCLWTVFEFFSGFKNRKTLVVIILPDAKYCHVNVECVCGNLGLVYQLCLPRHARRASEEYLKNAANKIKDKILPCNSLSGPCEDMCEDDPDEDDPDEFYYLDPDEFYYLDEEMGDGFESDDSDVEMSHSRHESGRRLPCSDETTEDGTRDTSISGFLERQ